MNFIDQRKPALAAKAAAIEKLLAAVAQERAFEAELYREGLDIGAPFTPARLRFGNYGEDEVCEILRGWIAEYRATGFLDASAR